VRLSAVLNLAAAEYYSELDGLIMFYLNWSRRFDQKRSRK
jgi:hypothetical protein